MWIPKYKVVGGLLAGYTPQGTLTGLAAMIDNYYGSFVSYGNDSDPAREWMGAFGSDGGPVLDYGRAHADQGQQTFPLMEIEFTTPPQSAFERQTLMIYATVICAKSEGGSGPDIYEGYNYTFTLSHFTRRWFVNGQWHEETVSGSMGGMIGAGNWVIVQGDRETVWEYNYLIKRLRYAFSEFTYDNTDYFGAAAYLEDERGDYTAGGSTHWVCNAACLMGIPKSVIAEYFGTDEEPETEEDPNEEPSEPGGGESGEGGGEGGHDRHQDAVPYPDDPPISGASAGFITMYEMTENNMQAFASELFDFDWWQAVKNFFADPMDFICGVMIVPFAPRTSGHACPVFHQASPLPDIKMSHYWPVIQDQYQDIDCGSLTVPKYYDSCFDYNPYTSVRIYLPYIGYKDLDPDEVMGNTIQVKYKVDCMTGDCIAFIIRTAVSMPSMTPVSQCIAQFSGNCGVRVAFGRQSFDSAIQASVQLMAGIAGGIIRGAGGAISAFMVGGAGGGASSESEALAQEQIARGAGGGMSMPNVEAMKSQVIKSGIMGANAGFMSVQKPFIIRSIPNQSRPGNYRQLNGYPANIEGPIGSRGFRGYMEIEKIELDGIAAMEQEKAELTAILGGGVLYGNP